MGRLGGLIFKESICYKFQIERGRVGTMPNMTSIAGIVVLLAVGLFALAFGLHGLELTEPGIALAGIGGYLATWAVALYVAAHS